MGCGAGKRIMTAQPVPAASPEDMAKAGVIVGTRDLAR
jgi:hypothetical protein